MNHFYVVFEGDETPYKVNWSPNYPFPVIGDMIDIETDNPRRQAAGIVSWRKFQRETKGASHLYTVILGIEEIA